ncbi:MAG: NUDIX domain-containing protein [Dehalococcoidia bacterium]
MPAENGPCPECGRWQNRPVTVIGVVLRGSDVAIIRRGGEPARGRLALPGGYLEHDETAAEGCRREVLEETNLDTRLRSFVGYYDAPDRSPAQTVSLAFLLDHTGGTLRAGDDAASATWLPLDAVPDNLAFDHNQIIGDVRRLLNADPAPGPSPR